MKLQFIPTPQLELLYAAINGVKKLVNNISVIRSSTDAFEEIASLKQIGQEVLEDLEAIEKIEMEEYWQKKCEECEGRGYSGTSGHGAFYPPVCEACHGTGTVDARKEVTDILVSEETITNAAVEGAKEQNEMMKPHFHIWTEIEDHPEGHRWQCYKCRETRAEMQDEEHEAALEKLSELGKNKPAPNV